MYVPYRARAVIAHSHRLLRGAMKVWKAASDQSAAARLLITLDQSNRAARHWNQATLRRTVRLWAQTAHESAEEHKAAERRQETWSKINGWLGDFDRHKAAKEARAAIQANAYQPPVAYDTHSHLDQYSRHPKGQAYHPVQSPAAGDSIFGRYDVPQAAAAWPYDGQTLLANGPMAPLPPRANTNASQEWEFLRHDYRSEVVSNIAGIGATNDGSELQAYGMADMLQQGHSAAGHVYSCLPGGSEHSVRLHHTISAHNSAFPDGSSGARSVYGERSSRSSPAMEAPLSILAAAKLAAAANNGPRNHSMPSSRVGAAMQRLKSHRYAETPRFAPTTATATSEPSCSGSSRGTASDGVSFSSHNGLRTRRNSSTASSQRSSLTEIVAHTLRWSVSRSAVVGEPPGGGAHP